MSFEKAVEDLGLSRAVRIFGKDVPEDFVAKADYNQAETIYQTALDNSNARKLAQARIEELREEQLAEAGTTEEALTVSRGSFCDQEIKKRAWYTALDLIETIDDALKVLEAAPNDDEKELAFTRVLELINDADKAHGIYVYLERNETYFFSADEKEQILSKMVDLVEDAGTAFMFCECVRRDSRSNELVQRAQAKATRLTTKQLDRAETCTKAREAWDRASDSNSDVLKQKAKDKVNDLGWKELARAECVLEALEIHNAALPDSELKQQTIEKAEKLAETPQELIRVFVCAPDEIQDRILVRLREIYR